MASSMKTRNPHKRLKRDDSPSQLRSKLFEALHNDDVSMATKLLKNVDADLDLQDEVWAALDLWLSRVESGITYVPDFSIYT